MTGKLPGEGATVHGDPLSILGEPDVAAALAAIAERGGQVFVEHRDSLTLRLAAGSLECKSDRDVGAGVRFGRGGPLAYASTNLLTPAGFRDAADIADSSSGTARSLAPGAGPALRKIRAVDPAHRPRLPVDALDIGDKADAVRRVAAAARALDARVRRVTVTYVDVVQHVVTIGPDRAPRSDIRTRTRVTCRVVARDDNRRASGFDGPGLGGGFELFDAWPPEAIGAAAAQRALLQLAAVDLVARDCPVVLGPSAGGMLVHEACGHGLEADLLARQTSVFASTRGDRLAREIVTIVDDPGRPAGFGSYGMDDEGYLSRRTALIAEGIQVAELTDGAAAASLDRPRSANGRRESYAQPPLCRMSNTYLEAGPDDAAAIMGDVSRGVYVARLSGGDVDTATGDFTFAASEAYAIEGGRLTNPLRGVTLIGNSFQALAAIDAVGDDLAFTEAMCGKDGQWVPVSYGSPTIRLASLTVTGTR